MAYKLDLLMAAFDGAVDIESIESDLIQHDVGAVLLSKEYYEEGIAIIYLNHPRKRNAVSGKMMVDFRKCVEELEKWKEGKAVIISGLGENFCSGGDLDLVKSAGCPKQGYYICYMMQDILKRFRNLPLVSVSLVHGAALGGGAEISIFSDYTLVTGDVQLGFVHGKMGITTAFGGMTRLIQLVGERRAMEMVLTAKVYSAEECVSIGLAYKIINTSNRLEETLAFIKTLTVHHYSIVRSYKQIAACAAGVNFEKCLVVERELFYPNWGSELNRKALATRIRHVNK